MATLARYSQLAILSRSHETSMGTLEPHMQNNAALLKLLGSAFLQLELKSTSKTFCQINTVLYTTMEPCNARLSGNRTCCDRIVVLKGKLQVVYVGIREPNTFIVDNDSKKRLEKEGIKFEMVPDVHDLYYEAAMEGHHENKPTNK